jgi:hypothetical protein
MHNTKHLLSTLLFVTVFLFLLSGCGTHGTVRAIGESGAVMVDVRHDGGYYKSALPDIPPGHMPPPGECRIWLPGVPPRATATTWRLPKAEASGPTWWMAHPRGLETSPWAKSHKGLT